MTTKALKIGASVKAVGAIADDAPHGWVEGIANAYERDRYDEVVLPTALAAAFPAFLKNPVLSFGHKIDGNPTDGSLPAGSVLSLTQDAAGSTHFRARFANTPDAQKVRQLYADGDMRAFSVQFITLDSRQPTPDELKRFPGTRRVITALDLIEIACAVVPVNAGSLATAAKAFDPQALQPAPALTLKAKAVASFKQSDEQKDLVEAAHKAYGAHAECMKQLATPLQELADKGDEEADHGATAGAAKNTLKAFTASHKALGDAVAALHKGMGGQDDGDDTDADNADDDEAMESAKAFMTAFEKQLKA